MSFITSFFQLSLKVAACFTDSRRKHFTLTGHNSALNDPCCITFVSPVSPGSGEAPGVEQPVSQYHLVTSAGPAGVTASPLHGSPGPSGAVSSPSVGAAAGAGLAAPARAPSPSTSAGHRLHPPQQVGRHPGVPNPNAGYTSSGSSGGQGLGVGGAPMAGWGGSHPTQVITTAALGHPPSGVAGGGGMGPGFPPSGGLMGNQTLSTGYNVLNRGVSVPVQGSGYGPGQMPPSSSNPATAAAAAASAGGVSRLRSLPTDLNVPAGGGSHGADWWGGQQGVRVPGGAPAPAVSPAPAPDGPLAPALSGEMRLDNPGLVRILQKALEEQWPAAKMQQLLATLSDSDLQTLMHLTAQPGAQSGQGAAGGVRPAGVGGAGSGWQATAPAAAAAGGGGRRTRI
jgi:hypothetical protein